MHSQLTSTNRHLRQALKLAFCALLACVIMVPLLASGLAAQDDDEKEIPKPRRVQIKISDQLQLNAAYFAAIKGKDAMPVIMLHDWKSQGGTLYSLALRIQKEGHAVLVPDLRGHGMSTTFGTRELNPDKFTKIDIIGMIADVEACKGFLFQRHHEGELNMEKLTVVGAGFGALLAMNWAVGDWNAQYLPARKIGQDVKSLVLLSPIASFKGVTNQDALTHPIVAGQLNTLILVGNQPIINNKELQDAKKLNNRLERRHGERPTPIDKAALAAHKLFIIEFETEKQGTDLLNSNLKPNDPKDLIWEFLRGKIVIRDVFNAGGREWLLEWKDRTDPLNK